jgi:hypothetical protein
MGAQLGREQQMGQHPSQQIDPEQTGLKALYGRITRTVQHSRGQPNQAEA